MDLLDLLDQRPRYQRGKSNFLRTNMIGIEIWNTICLIPTNKYIFNNQTTEPHTR